MINECKKLWLMVRTNMLEKHNFADRLSKCLKNNLFSQKLSLKSQPVKEGVLGSKNLLCESGSERLIV